MATDAVHPDLLHVRPTSQQHEIIDRSAQALAPPYVTGIDEAKAPLIQALNHAIASHGNQIGITGFNLCDRDSYEPLLHSASHINH